MATIIDFQTHQSKRLASLMPIVDIYASAFTAQYCAQKAEDRRAAIHAVPKHEPWRDPSGRTASEIIHAIPLDLF